MRFQTAESKARPSDSYFCVSHHKIHVRSLETCRVGLPCYIIHTTLPSTSCDMLHHYRQRVSPLPLPSLSLSSHELVDLERCRISGHDPSQHNSIFNAQTEHKWQHDKTSRYSMNTLFTERVQLRRKLFSAAAEQLTSYVSNSACTLTSIPVRIFAKVGTRIFVTNVKMLRGPPSISL